MVICNFESIGIQMMMMMLLAFWLSRNGFGCRSINFFLLVELMDSDLTMLMVTVFGFLALSGTSYIQSIVCRHFHPDDGQLQCFFYFKILILILTICVILVQGYWCLAKWLPWIHWLRILWIRNANIHKLKACLKGYCQHDCPAAA